MNELTQCAKCAWLGCDRGPGFADLADQPPSMWRCQCRCHPINHSDAAKFIADHVGANHGTVRTEERTEELNSVIIRCDCGAACGYKYAVDAPAVPTTLVDTKALEDVLASINRWMANPVGTRWECFALGEGDATATVQFLADRGISASWYRSHYLCSCGCNRMLQGWPKVSVLASDFDIKLTDGGGFRLVVKR